MIDVLIQEQGSGGEILIRNKDIVMIYGNENQPYLASFGGDDFFGNYLLLQGDEVFKAKTEKILLTTPLTSAGRQLIENALKDDLKYLEDSIPGTQISVSAKIVAKNRIDANVTINGETFYLKWNPDISFLNYNL